MAKDHAPLIGQLLVAVAERGYETSLFASGRLGQVHRVGADLGWCLIAVTHDDPGPIGDVLEAMQGLAQLLDGAEAADLQLVSLQRVDEPLDLLRRPHEGGQARDAEEDELDLEVVGDELASVIVTDLQAGGDALGEAAK